MTSDRPYRRGDAAPRPLAELRRCAGHAVRPAVVEAFCAVLAEQVSAERRLAA